MTEVKQKAKSTGKVFLIIIIFIVVMVFLIFRLNSGNSNNSEVVHTSNPEKYEIVYRITSPRQLASLTYANATGDTEQQDVILPWELKFDADKGQFLYISAQTKYTNSSISCVILVNGQEQEKAESTGDYVIASCSGSAGD